MKDVDNIRDDSDLTLEKRSILLFSSIESDVKFFFTSSEPNERDFIYAHKRVLSIGSCVFDRMFNGLMASTSSSSGSHAVVFIADISMECFENLLRFIYTGTVALNMGNIIEVMYAADKYQVCKLESVCCDYLYRTMDISTVLNVHESTLMFDNNITKLCLQWIDDLFDDLTKWNGFMDLRKATLMDLLKRDTINISELNLFKAVYKWAEKQCCDSSIEPSDANIRKMTDNFKHIRFPTMQIYEFAECTRYGLEILTSEEKIDVWDALAKVKHSVLFNSKKRIQSAMAYKAFTFSYIPSCYAWRHRLAFEFQVSRIVHLISISTIRKCCLSIFEKDSEERNFTKTTDVRVADTKYIRQTFVPNVTYIIVTVDTSFECDCHTLYTSRVSQCTHGCGKASNFDSYESMELYYNRITQIGYYNFQDHDPFIFTTPQRSHIRAILYKTRK